MSTYTGAEINNKGMVLYLDAANKKSYPGTGSTFYDISGNSNNATLYNSPTFTNERGGCFTFDNINTLFQINNLDLETLGVTRYYTVIFGVQKKFYGTGGNNVGNSCVLFASATGYTEGWRIIESNTGTPGAAFTGAATYQFGTPGASSSAAYVTDTVANQFSICAFTVNNTVATGFINGVTGTPATFSAYVPGTAQGTIGQQGFGVGSFAGLFGFMMIYNRALSSTEIYNNYLMIKELRGL